MKEDLNQHNNKIRKEFQSLKMTKKLKNIDF